MFVSHQGVSLCCVNPDKHKNIMPSEFWKGTVRADALITGHYVSRIKTYEVSLQA